MISIDKIYSRPRIRLPNLKRSDNKKIKKTYYFLLIWIIVIVTAVTITKFMDPIFNAICIEEAKKIGGSILSEESNAVLRTVDYNDFVIAEKDNNHSISMVKSNVIAINLASSDIKSNIQKRLNALEKQNISITMGSLSGNKFLSGIGPNMNLKIVPIGSVDTEFKSEFTESGINQTIHRLYLTVNCNIDILTPHKIITTTVSSQILFAENIIIGEVPDSYYNLEGMKNDDILEVVN